MTQKQDTVVGNEAFREFKERGYSVLSDGTILGQTGLRLKLRKGTSGYVQVNTFKNSHQKTFLVHRIVAMAFIPNPDNLPEVNHKDGNKGNNQATNLEWVTRSENIKHGIDSGLIKKSMVGRTGNKHWRSIPVLMYAISGESMTFENCADAAAKLGFHAESIRDACTGKIKTYKSVKWRYIR